MKHISVEAGGSEYSARASLPNQDAKSVAFRYHPELFEIDKKPRDHAVVQQGTTMGAPDVGSIDGSSGTIVSKGFIDVKKYIGDDPTSRCGGGWQIPGAPIAIA
ncbi:hypothetical protein ELI16_14345 [Rhizobium ruizarguesonis]|uniref:hypothetical protein n=1 Tax=Rhizobium ruizarguesonis TaxID=2081791 RepID=UPI00102FB5E9|nr:hypothetical protein [Rhizobium ruizarguesonis]TAW73033.1 hypothetical protein ELI16_14345 [Rhizobium ruizarguesonis]